MNDRAFASVVLVVGSVFVGWWEWTLRRAARPAGATPAGPGLGPAPGIGGGDDRDSFPWPPEAIEEWLRRGRRRLPGATEDVPPELRRERGQTPGINPRPFSAERAVAELGDIWS